MRNRQIKTFQEKYSSKSWRKEVEFMFANATREELHDEYKLFEYLPYVGYLYVYNEPDFSPFIYYAEEYKLRCKVIEVTDTTVTIVHMDDHHHSMCIRKDIPTKEYRVYGNELIKIKVDEDDPDPSPKAIPIAF